MTNTYEEQRVVASTIYVAAGLGIMFLAFIVLGLQAWVVMLLMGALSTVVPWIPAGGYWACVLGLVIFNVGAAIVRYIRG